MKNAQVTIKDIAKILGISPSTVSRSLNDHPDISIDTKRLVTELAKKLNYEPNVTAQNLRSQTTKTIGVIIPEIVHFFFSTVINGIELVATEAGYHIMFCQSNESYEKEVQDTKSLLSHRVDGFLISYAKTSKDFDHFREIEKKNVPIVFFDRMMTEMDVSNVVVEDYDGAKQATLHLAEQGCKRIAHIAAPAHLSIGQQRISGYKDALKESKLPFQDELIIDDGGGQKEDGYRCTQSLLKLKNRPDAIFANNDMVAYGAIEAIKEAGLKIPQDIAVVGFSNWQFSNYIEPKLSTIEQPGFEMGKMAMKLLIEEMNSKEENIKHQTILLPTKLNIRTSSLRKEVLI